MFRLLILLCLTTLSWALPFFPINISSIFYPTRNLSCNYRSSIPADLCMIEQDTWVMNSSGTIQTNTTTRTSDIFLTHSYTPLISFQSCASGLTSITTDIGYATCSPRPFQSSTVSTSICVCATNNCTASYNSCVASVNAMTASNTAPSRLPQNILPTLSNRIICSENISWMHNSYNQTSLYYYCLSYSVANFPTVNITMCERYLQNNTVLCSVQSVYSSTYGLINELLMSLGIEEYQPQLSIDLASYLYNVRYPSIFPYGTNFTYRVYESSTSVLIYQWYIVGCEIVTFCFCYCKTNYCNQNISTCTTGMNFNCRMNNATIIANSSCHSTSSTTNATTTTLPSNITTTRTTTTTLPTNITTARTTTTTTTTPSTSPLSTSTLVSSGTNLSNTTTVASTTGTTTSGTTNSDQSWLVKLLGALLALVGVTAIFLGCALACSLKSTGGQQNLKNNGLFRKNRENCVEWINDDVSPDNAATPFNKPGNKNRQPNFPKSNV